MAEAQTTLAAPAGAPAAGGGKIPFTTTWSEWRMPLYYMLSLALFGLSFYPAFILIALILVNRWKHDRYDFSFMLLLLWGNFSFVDKAQTGIFLSDVALFGSLVLWLLYRRPPLLNKILLLIAVYIAGLFVFASLSVESMSIQFLTMRMYMGILYIIIPIAIFTGAEFDINIFFRKAIIYAVIIAVFYFIDSFIISGNLFVPNTAIFGGTVSRFYDLYWQPLSMHPFRKYPPGMYLLMLAIYPIARMYKIRPWQWVALLLGLMSTFTFTVIIGYVVVYFFLVVKPSKIFKYGLALVAAACALYFLDCVLPVTKENRFENKSALRIKSSIEQIKMLTEAVDDEDVAEFASGRMAQILPKFDLLAREHRQAYGLGFLHREKTKLMRYTIINEYYPDIAENEEVATGIEVVPAQIYVTIGYLGLIFHTLVFLFLYLLVRRLRYSVYVLTLLFLNVLVGLGGYAGLNGVSGLFLTSTAFAAVILANRREVWGRAYRPARKTENPE